MTNFGVYFFYVFCCICIYCDTHYFKINKGILPSKYDRFGFIITGVSHEIGTDMKRKAIEYKLDPEKIGNSQVQSVGVLSEESILVEFERYKFVSISSKLLQ